MKALIFLIAIGLVVYAGYWWLKKTQEEEELARRRAVRARKQRDGKALKPTTHRVWPVIIRPVSGEHPPEDEVRRQEPVMTTIAYAPSDQTAAEEESTSQTAS
jgi:hypothetical protein